MKSKNKKSNGSYYTPKEVANFIIDFTFENFNCKEAINILEPSAGNGTFLSAILEQKKTRCFDKVSVTLVEKDNVELEEALKLAPDKNWQNFRVHSYNQDFLDFLNTDSSKYSLIVGNPPYIKKSYLTAGQIEWCGKIHQNANLSKNRIKNIWTSFVIGCTKRLSDNGILAFVLPSEFLQVKFAAEIRQFLYKEFERIEIFTFNQLLFECTGQDTILFVGHKKAKQKGVLYADIADLKELKRRDFILKPNTSIQTTSTKWTHHFLSSSELNLIHKLRSSFEKINYYCTSKAGIVTAANQYFIVPEKVVSEFGLHSFTVPIIQRGFFVNGGVVFNEENFKFLVKSGKPAYLLSFSKFDEEVFSGKIAEYLDIGVKRKISERYKCLKRKRWFDVPNVGTSPDGFFFKRSHHYPKLLKNEADVLVTDSAYKIVMKEGFQIESLVHSFYNSLTIAFAELEGRYYGGGVLELTPNEFKQLPIPYMETDPGRFKEFARKFESGNDKNTLLEENDKILLHAIRGIDTATINKLAVIRKKLGQRRLKTAQNL